MERTKNKLEILLLYVTLVISLSAFKEDLSKINIPLGYSTITASSYLLYCVYGFSFCLYLYLLDFVFGDTRLRNWRLWKWLTDIAFYTLGLILSTPVLLFAVVIIYKLIKTFSGFTAGQTSFLLTVFNTILAVGTTLVSFYASSKIRSKREFELNEKIEEQEIKELENATKLLKDGYYSHSILESYKVLETHLRRELNRRNSGINRTNVRLPGLIEEALKYEVLTPGDINSVDAIRHMRNVAAHLNSDHNEDQAEFALEFVKGLLTRNSRT